MDLKLQNKVVVVTGGSAGIGFESCLLFAQEGARVLIAARRPDKLAQAAEKLRSEVPDAQVDTISVDVTKVADLDRLVDYVAKTYGRIDVLVNNAGTGTYKPFLEVTDEELVYGMEINFFAQFRLIQRFTPMMIEQGGASIVNVTGKTSVQVMPPPYRSSCTGPAKAAENRLTRVLATELGEHNIRVNAVVPGLVNTEERWAKWEREMAKRELDEDEAAATRTEWGKGIVRPGHEWGRPEELADLIVFAASDRASFITGAILIADGGEDRS